MSQNLPTLVFVDAMVGATAYAHPQAVAKALPFATEAIAHVQRARVDIYCSHNNQAIVAIREARQALQSVSFEGVADILVALDEASWHTRHNEFVRAEDALESALDQMRARVGASLKLP